MTAILEALTFLDQSLDKLEKVATAAQEQKSLKQQDLFGQAAGSLVKNSSGNVIHIDPAALAKKLDVTIERIEQVLREG